VGDPGCPEGMRRVPEDEKEQTLALLEMRLAEAQTELARAPRGADSISARKFRSELESRMQELEDAIAVFSRTNVLVEDPEPKSRAAPAPASTGSGRHGARGSAAVRGYGAGAGARKPLGVSKASSGSGRAVKSRVPSHRVAGSGGRGAEAGGRMAVDRRRAGAGSGRRALGGRSGSAEDDEEENLGPVISNIPAGMF